MKIIGLDNREYSWNFAKYSTPSSNPSSLHLRARLLLKTMFPYDVVGEELVVPGIKTEINNRPLLLDFYIHSLRLALEIQGRQHSEFVSFFHGNKLEFFRAKRLDGLKRQWCTLNNITLVELPHDETDTQWSQRIRNK